MRATGSQLYFRTEERRLRLTHAAAKWLGTPWRPNSFAQGPQGGVSCHNLPRQLYIATGAFAESFPVVTGDPAQTKHSKVSVIEPFLDARPELLKLQIGRDALQVGDLLGLRIRHCVDHLGVVLDGGMFIHVLMHTNTRLDGVAVPPWSQRIITAWRPIES